MSSAMHIRIGSAGTGGQRGGYSPTRAQAKPLHKEVRELVQFALDQRARMAHLGLNRIDQRFLDDAMRPLHVWMRENPLPSVGTLRAFWKAYAGTLRIVMPSNCSKKMARLESLLSTL